MLSVSQSAALLGVSPPAFASSSPTARFRRKKSEETGRSRKQTWRRASTSALRPAGLNPPLPTDPRPFPVEARRSTAALDRASSAEPPERCSTAPARRRSSSAPTNSLSIRRNRARRRHFTLPSRTFPPAETARTHKGGGLLMRKDASPCYIVFAGVNGAGKSTLFNTGLWRLRGMPARLPRPSPSRCQSELQSGNDAFRACRHRQHPARP